MGREHPGEEHRQLVGQHHPAVQKQAPSRSSQADELLGNPRQVGSSIMLLCRCCSDLVFFILTQVFPAHPCSIHLGIPLDLQFCILHYRFA